MKKYIAAALAALAILSLCACDSKKEPKALDLDAFTKQVVETVKYDDDMVSLSEQIASEYYNLSFDGLEDWAAYGSGTAATTNELMVMKLKDDAALTKAQEIIQSRVDDQIANYEGYRPDELFRLENAVVEAQTPYLLFSVSPDNDAVKKLFADALK